MLGYNCALSREQPTELEDMEDSKLGRPRWMKCDIKKECSVRIGMALEAMVISFVRLQSNIA